jgi:hypothetical protein
LASDLAPVGRATRADYPAESATKRL